MADDDSGGKLSFELDLDAKNMIDSLESIKDQLVSLSETKGIDALTASFTKMALPLALVGTALVALKGAFDASLDAEHVEQVNTQFQTLAANAGIAGNELEESLQKSSGGLVGNTELLQAASRAIVQMGGSAKDLGETMEVARKTTLLFGGNLVDNFEKINHAIAVGSQRQLQAMGITVNVQKTYEDYAQSIGTTADALSQAGRQQALLNAVVAFGGEHLAGATQSSNSLTASWQRLKVAVGEASEIIQRMIGTVFGPIFQKVVGAAADTVSNFSDQLLSHFGNATEQAAAKSRLLTKEYEGMNGALDDLSKKGQAFYMGTLIQSGTQAADDLQKRHDEIKKQLESETKFLETEKQKQAAAIAQKPGGGQADQIDKEKQKKNESKFQAELNTIRETALKQRASLSKNYYYQENLDDDEYEASYAKHQQKILAIDANKSLTQAQKLAETKAENQAWDVEQQVLDQKKLDRKVQFAEEEKRLALSVSDVEQAIERQKEVAAEERDAQLKIIEQTKFEDEQQKQQAKLLAEHQYQAQITQIQAQAFSDREQAMQRWVYSSNNAAEQFARGFASASQKAKNDLMNFGAQGAKMADMLTSHMGDAFVKMGEGAGKGSDIMKGAMFGLMADIAQNYGMMALQMGLVPPNPLFLGAGAALLVLSGYLRSKANTGGGGASIGGGGDIGGGGGGYADSTTTSPTSQVQQNQLQPKAVHLEVHGDILDSDQSRQRMAELIRQSIDATDFSITKVGGGL